jgi:TATA-binding protein-associated factor
MAASLSTILQSDPPSHYQELDTILARVALDCQALYAAFDAILPSGRTPSISGIKFTLQHAHNAVNGFSTLAAQLSKPLKKRSLPDLELRHSKLIMVIGFFDDKKKASDRSVAAAAGAALISLQSLPAKLTPIIRSITNSIKVSTFYTRRLDALTHHINVAERG